MVGHTGKLDPAIHAVEAVDVGVGAIVDAVRAAGGALLVTADHGNCEQMTDAKGEPHTAHTLNPVPLYYLNDARPRRHARRRRAHLRRGADHAGDPRPAPARGDDRALAAPSLSRAQRRTRRSAPTPSSSRWPRAPSPSPSAPSSRRSAARCSSRRSSRRSRRARPSPPSWSARPPSSAASRTRASSASTSWCERRTPCTWCSKTRARSPSTRSSARPASIPRSPPPSRSKPRARWPTSTSAAWSIARCAAPRWASRRGAR